ncbi:DNA polymerase III subunit chi [Marinibaculum pumilum]|uniref:DNA polymerase III subunit chi n=1 Tax=Marinibaculum pumilum TaxID=1766165 RepID=A0ABV7KTH6_9PROT
MPEVHFYHLERLPLEKALPQLLEKCLQRGWRAVVRASTPERVEALTGQLWDYDRESFLPHGSAQDGEAAAQPIWLTHQAENPNGAQVLFLVDGADLEAAEGYERVCDLFDGSDSGAVAAARDRWRKAKAAGASLKYWQHGEKGWENRASG